MYLKNTKFTPEQREIILTNALTSLAVRLALFNPASRAAEIAQAEVLLHTAGVRAGFLDPDRIEAEARRMMAGAFRKEAA